MSDFDQVRPSPELLDAAYEDAEEMIESFVSLWRLMKDRGTPQEFLDAEGKTSDWDTGFLSGGIVALEALLGEFTAKRDTIFLES